MMAHDTALDFRTRDYIDTGTGEWLETEDSRTAVLFQLESRRGAWFGDADAGSRIAELIESGEPVSAAQLRDEALRCLQVLVEDAIISDLVVEEDVDEAGRAAIVLHYRDRTTGSPVDIAYSPWGGSPR
jgi:hypothetical protein